MTTTPAPNVITTAVALIAASVAAVVALLLWHPELFLWIVAVFAACAIVGLMIVAAEARGDAADWCAKAEELERKLEARAPGVTMVPRVTFTAAVPVAVERPDLRIVGPPPSRLTDDQWFAALYDENGEHRA